MGVGVVGGGVDVLWGCSVGLKVVMGGVLSVSVPNRDSDKCHHACSQTQFGSKIAEKLCFKHDGNRVSRAIAFAKQSLGTRLGEPG